MYYIYMYLYSLFYPLSYSKCAYLWLNIVRHIHIVICSHSLSNQAEQMTDA